MNEKSISTKIVKYVNGHHQDVAFLYKRLGGIGNKGMADISGIINGRRVEIEVKVPERRGNTSKLQEHYIEKYKRLGAVSGVATSLEEALELMGL